MMTLGWMLRRCCSNLVCCEKFCGPGLTPANASFMRSAATRTTRNSRVAVHVSAQSEPRRSPADKRANRIGSSKFRKAPSSVSAEGIASRSRPSGGRTGTTEPPAEVSYDGGNHHATFVPRNPGIKDGAWSAVDTKIVKKAQTDAVMGPKHQIAEGAILLGMSEADLRQLAVSSGQPEYRGKQLYDALLKGSRSLDTMTTIPSTWRAALAESGIRTGRSNIYHSVKAPDDTTKFLLQLADGRVVETVGIPATDNTRLTVCVSSQVGCPMRCTFCATGKGGFARNLRVHEIVDQVLTIQEKFGRRVTNVVFMGMGEPLLNLPSVLASFKFMNEDMGIGARNITISTVGVPNAIAKLAKHNIKATLAVSIHAPNQRLRERLIPSAKAYPLEALMEDCTQYFQATGRRVTFEYTLMGGVNDAPAHAQELAGLLRKHDLASHVNVIPWNPVDESEYQRPSNNTVYRFKEVLEKEGVQVSVRITRGLEAAAACGQLRNSFQKQPLEEFAVPL